MHEISEHQGLNTAKTLSTSRQPNMARISSRHAFRQPPIEMYSLRYILSVNPLASFEFRDFKLQGLQLGLPVFLRRMSQLTGMCLG